MEGMSEILILNGIISKLRLCHRSLFYFLVQSKKILLMDFLRNKWLKKWWIKLVDRLTLMNSFMIEIFSLKVIRQLLVKEELSYQEGRSRESPSPEPSSGSLGSSSWTRPQVVSILHWLWSPGRWERALSAEGSGWTHQVRRADYRRHRPQTQHHQGRWRDHRCQEGWDRREGLSWWASKEKWNL